MSIATFPAPRTFAGVRLNRRGRALARTLLMACAVLAVGLAALTIVLVASNSQALAGGTDSNAASATAEVSYVVVGPGETLWDIAAAAAGPEDTREVMTQIVEMNALSTSVLQPGQRLAVPDLG